jgi:hypothetical protein
VSEVDQLWNNFHLRGLLEFLDLVFLLQNSVEKNLNVSPIIDLGMSRPRLPHYWSNGDPAPVNWSMKTIHSMDLFLIMEHVTTIQFKWLYFEIKKNQSLFKGMQVHVYLNLTLLLNKGIASRQVNEMKTTHVHVFSWIIPLTYFWKSFDYTLWICLVINSLWITFHVCLWLLQFGGWGYVNMNSVIFHLHMIDVYLCFCLWIFLQV